MSLNTPKLLKFHLSISFFLLIFVNQVVAEVYLDGSTANCNNGNSTYDPSSRSCGSGNDTVYIDLAGFSANIVPGKTNYLREGSYFRDNMNGSLELSASHSGTPTSFTVISAYPGEERQVIIGTATRGATYNSNPGDTNWKGSADYYPNSAILITETNYVKISGLKTYGQIYSRGNHDVIIQDSDFGGGGPSENQGNVVKLNNVYNATVKNNLIHNSCWGENNENGSAIIFYDASAVIENNTFYDNWGYDVFYKDSGKQSGRRSEFRYNYFGPSKIFQNIGGFRGHNQDVQVSSQSIHHNIFANKYVGITVLASPAKNDVYNNSFINCDIDISSSSSGGPYQIRTYNNIFYHSSPGQIFMQLYAPNYIIDTDWNIYFGQGSWAKSAPGAYTWENNLSGWQAFVNLDTHSITIDPDFLNPTGANPNDFQRNSYSENFQGSPYSTKAGAFETGKEIIGSVAGTISTSPPVVISAPTGLRIINTFH